MSEDGRRAHAQGIILHHWSRLGNLPLVVVSLCVFCGKLRFSRESERGNRGDWHQRCLSEWLGTPAGRRYASRRVRRLEAGLMPHPPAGPGRPPTRENLRRHFAWAIVHHLGGWSYREIAEREGVHFTTVRGAISYIMERLPEPELVRKDFRHHVQFLEAHATVPAHSGN